MKRSSVFWSLVVFFVFLSTVRADNSQLINLQGILRQPGGTPVPDGSYAVTFKIYNAAVGGSALWMETQSVATSNGLFTAHLGAATPVSDSIFNDATRFLGIAVSPDPEMTPRQRLTSASYAFSIPGYEVSGDNVILVRGTTTLASSGDSVVRVMRLGGSIGIGTDPTEKLDVAGNIKTSDTLFASNVSSNSPLNLQAPAGITRMFISDLTGNVGIGTVAPRGKLDVTSGRLHFDGSADYGIVWGTYGLGTMLAHIHRWNVDNRLYVTNSGALNLTGVYLASGGTAWVSTSDRRLKENIREAPYGLNTVLQLPVHAYNLKGSSENKIGFIAQEIYPILPEIVSKGDDGEYTPPSSPLNIESAGSTPVSSPWGIDYAGLTPVLVKAIQEQQRQIEELKALVQKLSAKK